eukprot:TRINITY_DN35830_c0_g1_i1.p1 TRINITY_DN35830_c0_g1~~TRINITY_DN35830_c0_g1_i1.p1  ORF type:complete len:754 (+),score=140.53 TRINITY_DN35830_c0_g1_i1:83-2344(+)
MVGSQERRLEVIVLGARGLTHDPSAVVSEGRRKVHLTVISPRDQKGDSFGAKVSPWTQPHGPKKEELRFGGSGLHCIFPMGASAPSVVRDARFAESAQLRIRLLASKVPVAEKNSTFGDLAKLVSSSLPTSFTETVTSELDEVTAHIEAECLIPMANIISGRVGFAADRALGGWVPLRRLNPNAGPPLSEDVPLSIWMQMYVLPDHEAMVPMLKGQLQEQLRLQWQAQAQEKQQLQQKQQQQGQQIEDQLANGSFFNGLKDTGRPINVCGSDSAQYAGYISVGAQNRYFYWLAESRSSEPRKDPLILWMTGGPGCSSILALLTENGPCKVQKKRGFGFEEELETIRNKWSWTEAANVLWVDQPAGVGYSIGQAVHDERGVADRMYKFLKGFYDLYPQFLKVPLYIFGESYGGHYVPAVATAILDKQDHSFSMPLAGIGIGNGLVNPYWQYLSKPTMAATGGVGGSLGRGIMKPSIERHLMDHLPTCLEAIENCQKNRKRWKDAYIHCILNEDVPESHAGWNPYDLRQRCYETTPVNCFDFSAETLFLRSEITKSKLGVDASTFWTLCNFTVNLGFVQSGDFFSKSDTLIARLLEAGKPVLVYSGDTDSTVDWIGSKLWVESLNWTHQKEWNQQMDSPFRIGGVAKGMQRSSHGLTFLQIYDAGHLVPLDQPQVALAMVKEFISSNSTWTGTEFVSGPLLRSWTDVSDLCGLALALLLAGSVLVKVCLKEVYQTVFFQPCAANEPTVDYRMLES